MVRCQNTGNHSINYFKGKRDLEQLVEVEVEVKVEVKMRGGADTSLMVYKEDLQVSEYFHKELSH